MTPTNGGFLSRSVQALVGESKELLGIGRPQVLPKLIDNATGPRIGGRGNRLTDDAADDPEPGRDAVRVTDFGSPDQHEGSISGAEVLLERQAGNILGERP